MDRRAKTDIKPLPFSAGENNDVDYNDYDKIRKVVPIRENRSCYIGARTLSTEMSCPICLDLLSQTMTAKECLHRFCSECITMALQRGNKECPTCRKKLVSKRSLRPDPHFDLLISRVWPDRSLYDNLQLHDVDNGTPASSSNLMTSIEEGMREQVNKRKRDQGLSDNDRQPKKPRSEDEDFPEINDDDVDDNEDNFQDDFETNEEETACDGEGDVEFKNIEAFDDIAAHGEDVDGVMPMPDSTLNNDEDGCNDWDGYDEYDAYDMNGLSSEQQDELQADLEELDVLEYDSYESDYSDEDDEEGYEDEEDGTEDFPGDDVDAASSPGNDDDLTGDDSQDMPDDEPNDDVMEDSKVADNEDSNSPDDTNTETTEPALQCVENSVRCSQIEPLHESINGSGNGINSGLRQSTVITAVPEFNSDYEEKFESISPPEMENGDSNETDPQDGNEGQEGSEDDSESTTTYSSSGFTSTTSGESSSISIIFSDDDEELNMNVMFPAELPMAVIEATSGVPGCSGLTNLSAPLSMLPTSSSGNLPVPSMIAGPSSSMAAGPSSNSSTIAGPSSVAHGSSPGLSANSGSLIKLPPTSLSALAEELPPFRDPDAIERVPEGSTDEVRPPSNSIPPKDRLNHWLANSPSSPQSPVEDMAVMPERRADDVDMMEPAISGSEEMEAELLPALSLSARDCPEELLIPRYVRAKHDTKMEHLAEFIHQRAMEEAQSNQTDFDADPVPTIPKPKHFYVFSRNGGHHVKQIFLHETMTTASCAMTQGDHLIIFYDIASIELRCDRQSILTDVVPPHFLSLPTV